MFIEDLTDFVLLSIDKINDLPQQLNIGIGHDYMVKDYYQIAAKIIGYDGKFIYELDKPTGMQQKLLNIDLLKRLGWQAKYSLEYGLQETYDYFLSCYNDH